MDTLAQLARRLAEVEQRLDRLESPPEAAQGAGQGAGQAARFPVPSDPTRFWAIEQLRGRGGEPFESVADAPGAAGSVVFAGVAETPGAGSVVWQEEHPVPTVLAADWRPAASALAALGHPIRLELIRRLLRGAHTTQELATIPDLGTSGQLYHHLRELQAAGLVVQQRRNRYAVPSDRVIACLVLVVAGLGGRHVVDDES